MSIKVLNDDGQGTTEAVVLELEEVLRLPGPCLLQHYGQIPENQQHGASGVV